MAKDRVGLTGEMGRLTRGKAWREHFTRRGAPFKAELVCVGCGKTFEADIVPQSNQTRPLYCGPVCRRRAAQARRKAREVHDA